MYQKRSGAERSVDCKRSCCAGSVFIRRLEGSRHDYIRIALLGRCMKTVHS
jgi:hypothetical protein